MSNCNSSNKSMEERVEKIIEKLRNSNNVVFFLRSQGEKISVKIDKKVEIIEGIPQIDKYCIEMKIASLNLTGKTVATGIKEFKKFLEKLKRDQDRLKADLVFHMI